MHLKKPSCQSRGLVKKIRHTRKRVREWISQREAAYADMPERQGILVGRTLRCLTHQPNETFSTMSILMVGLLLGLGSGVSVSSLSSSGMHQVPKDPKQLRFRDGASKFLWCEPPFCTATELGAPLRLYRPHRGCGLDPAYKLLCRLLLRAVAWTLADP